MTSGEKRIGRIAFRQEGKMWNAYFAADDTMEGAVLLGSIILLGIDGNDQRRMDFMNMMRGVFSDLSFQALGVRPFLARVEDAPEHERAGNA